MINIIGRTTNQFEGLPFIVTGAPKMAAGMINNTNGIMNIAASP